nr:hypothetical protein [Nocardia grenadensis]
MTARSWGGYDGSSSASASAVPRTSIPRITYGSRETCRPMTNDTRLPASTLRHFRLARIRIPPISIVPSAFTR